MKSILSLIISGVLVVSGFGQTRSVLVGTNNAVVQPTNFWSADASNARSGLGLGTAATNPASAFQPSSLALTNLASNNGANLTNLTAANINGTVALASNLSTPLALTNGGTGATNAATARTNLGLGITNNVEFAYVEAPYFFVGDGTNGIVFETDASRNITLTNLGLGATNSVTFGQLAIGTDIVIGDTTTTWSGQNRINYEELRLQGGNWQIDGGSLIIAGGTNQSLYQAQTRTNIGLPWTGLTNTNAATFQTALFGSGTNPVLVNTGGSVVSPTNFWQAAPIATALQNSQPVANATNAATNARLLFLFSLAPSTTGVTNTITLPTNGSTFNGDVATITHAGPTSSVTAIRELGASTNLITLNQVDETVRFLYRNDQWEFMDNISYIEPIYFSGTNATANAAASRTNLGLGNISTNGSGDLVIDTNLVVTNGQANFTNLQTEYLEFGINNSYLYVVGTNATPIVFEETVGRTNFIHGLGLGPTNNVQFNYLDIVNVGGANNIVASFVADGTPLEIYTADEPFSAGYGTTNFGIGVDSEGFKIKYGTNSTAWGSPVLTDNSGTNLLQPSNVTNFRSAIGIPLPALTNTNNAEFQAAVFNTNTAPTNTANVNGVGFNTAIGWMEVTVQTNGTNATFRIPLFQ